jgi:ribosome-binding protein aMBF1 (putative translation factor)
MADRKTTRNGLEILKRQFGIDPNEGPEIRGIDEDYRIAQAVYDARVAAGITQQQLAKAIGSTQSVISQLENADFDSHSLLMLRRIADALQMRLRVEFVPARTKAS